MRLQHFCCDLELPPFPKWRLSSITSASRLSPQQAKKSKDRVLKYHSISTILPLSEAIISQDTYTGQLHNFKLIEVLMKRNPRTI